MVYTIFIFHLILITFIFFELIVIKASGSMPSKFSLAVMIFKLKLIAVKLVKGEAIANLWSYYTASCIALYSNTVIFGIMTVCAFEDALYTILSL